MSKKGARSSGSGAGLRRNKDAAMAHHLPPAPETWRKRAAEWPYHNNLGTTHNTNKRPTNKG